MRAVPPTDADPPGPLWKRLAWFGAIATGAALTTALVAYALRALLTV